MSHPFSSKTCLISRFVAGVGSLLIGASSDCEPCLRFAILHDDVAPNVTHYDRHLPPQLPLYRERFRQTAGLVRGGKPGNQSTRHTLLRISNP